MADLSGLNDSFDHNLFADMLDETIPMLNDENEDEDIFDPNVATPSPTPSGNGKLGENWVEETPRVEMGKAEVHGLVFAYDLPSVATSDPTAPTQPYNLDLGRISTEMDPIIENILRRTEELVPNSAESSPRAVNFMDVLAVTDDSQVTDKMEVAINQYRSTEPNAEVVDVYEFVPSQLAAPTSTKGKRKKKSSKVPLLVKKSLKWSVVPRKAKGSRKTNGQISAQPKIERRKIIAENKEESTKKVKAEEAGPLKVKVAVNSSKVEKKPIVKQEPNGDPEVSSSRRRKTTAGNLQSGKMIKKEMSEKLKAKEKPTKSEESGDNSIMETDSDAPLINYTKSVDIKKSAKKPIKEEIPKVRKSFKPPKSEEITPGKRETENISNALLNHRRKTLSNKSNSWPLKKLKGEVEQKNMKFVRAKETKEENIDPDTPSILLCSKLDKDHLRKIVKDLGGKISTCALTCTQLVMETKIRRTAKFLCAIGRGIPVVTQDWLLRSAKAGRFLDTSRFLIGDSESEAKWKFSLRKTLAVASGDPLLSGRKFLVTPSVQPGGEEFVQIVKGAGGEVVQRWRGSTDVIVISAEADRGLWGKFHQAELPVYSVELLLTGILQHKLELGQNKLE